MSDPSPRRLTAEQLAFESNAPKQLVDELASAGVIAAVEGTYSPDDAFRVRLAQAVQSAGVSVADLAYIGASGAVRTLLPVGAIPSLGATSDPTGRTFEAFAASLGERAALLPEVYAAFGLAEPPPGTAMQRDEEAALVAFLNLWSMLSEDREVFVRAARIAGEGIRSLVVGTIDLFDEMGGSPPSRLRRGLPVAEAVAPSARLPDVFGALLPWLRARHTEHEVFSRIVDFTERSLAEVGRLPARPDVPPAIAFVDLSGFTERTAQGGDELAARDAATLQGLAQAASSAHGGRVVKLLGDGVMLRFGSPSSAIDAVRELMTAVAAAGLPQAHAGLAAGPLVIRDGDVYGNTVNLASRIAGQSGPGELLVPADLARTLEDAGAWEDAGEAQLKGIEAPVALARLRV